MKLTYVIVTRNRRDTLLKTLALLETNTRLPRHQWEVIVVDNASEDGTARAVTSQFRSTSIIRLPENEGVPARNHALEPARGRYIAFLDDDSYPLDDAIPTALAYLSRRPNTAALVARVLLPDGSAEAPAMPTITLGGASIVRREVLDKVGGFAPEFFRQAEEYEMSFRIWAAGYRIERFEDVKFGHDKVAAGRSSSLARRMDLRNNLILVERYLPRSMRGIYRAEWLERYAALGLHEGHREAIAQGVREARIWARRERAVGRRELAQPALERIFQWDAQQQAVESWARAHDVIRVAIADVSKNVYATYRACRESGLDIAAVLENGPAFAGALYRGLPVLSDAQSSDLSIDGIVLSNINAAQVDRRFAELCSTFNVPVLRLWEPRLLGEAPVRENRSPAKSEPRPAAAANIQAA